MWLLLAFHAKYSTAVVELSCFCFIYRRCIHAGWQLCHFANDFMCHSIIWNPNFLMAAEMLPEKVSLLWLPGGVFSLFKARQHFSGRNPPRWRKRYRQDPVVDWVSKIHHFPNTPWPTQMLNIKAALYLYFNDTMFPMYLYCEGFLQQWSPWLGLDRWGMRRWSSQANCWTGRWLEKEKRFPTSWFWIPIQDINLSKLNFSTKQGNDWIWIDGECDGGSAAWLLTVNGRALEWWHNWGILETHGNKRLLLEIIVMYMAIQCTAVLTWVDCWTIRCQWLFLGDSAETYVGQL